MRKVKNKILSTMAVLVMMWGGTRFRVAPDQSQRRAPDSNLTLIANAFLEAEIDRLSAAVSSGLARCKVRKARLPKEAKEKNMH